MADEMGLEEHTPHTHLYLHSSSSLRFSTLKKRFPDAHIEAVKGTPNQNRDYILKIGKWEHDEKRGTIMKETFEEWGNLPEEREKQKKVFAQALEMIKAGATNTQIINALPFFMTKIEALDKVRQEFLLAEYKTKHRLDLRVIYVFGKTGVGKTRYVYNQHDTQDIYRVTDYKHPFDQYTGEPVIVFEEFRSQLDITQMLNYLDIYPTQLSARYYNKLACFETVYILSNDPLTKQYSDLGADNNDTRDAFYRRIHEVYHLTKEGMIELEHPPKKTFYENAANTIMSGVQYVGPPQCQYSQEAKKLAQAIPPLQAVLVTPSPDSKESKESKESKQEENKEENKEEDPALSIESESTCEK